VAARTIAGETLLVPLRRGLADCDRIFILNEVGAFLWQALDGRDDRDALVRRIEGEFDTAPGADLGRDVDAFLAALDERGLITWEPRG
jgi:hypothetical protein